MVVVVVEVATSVMMMMMEGVCVWILRRDYSKGALVFECKCVRE